MRCGKFGGSAKTTVFLIKTPGKYFSSFPGQMRIYLLLHFHTFRRNIQKNIFRRCQQVFSVYFPLLCNGKKQITEPHHAISGCGWKISSRIKRLLLRCHKNTHRPAAVSRNGLTDRHIHTVNIRTFLPVHLNSNKIFIENLCNLLILKTFMSHHMAPVTSTVSDAQKYRFILLLRFFKSLFSPGIPVYRITGMLQKIRAGFILQTITHTLSTPSDLS